jgi:dsRNA-specific ribonuclease
VMKKFKIAPVFLFYLKRIVKVYTEDLDFKKDEKKKINFSFSVSIPNMPISGHGEGCNKKEAMVNAAMDLLDKLEE